MSITTKKGDYKQTDIKGKRILKSDIKIEAIGLIDDAIAYLLLADSYYPIEYIKEIIDGLSSIAGYLANYCQLADLVSLTAKMEQYIQANEKAFTFSYNYGQTSKLYVNLARTKVRDLERTLCKLDLDNQEIYCYINRLSDFCYIIFVS